MKVYDKVWVMKNNEPRELMIFCVMESMNYAKDGTDIYYLLVKEVCGTGWGNNEGTRYHSDNVFKSKTKLLYSLIKGNYND